MRPDPIYSLNNLLVGGSAADTLMGASGNDTLRGGGGNDSLDGGAGDDTYSFNTSAQLGADTVRDSSGIDGLSFYGSTNDIEVSLAITSVQTVNPNLTLSLDSATSIENIFGGFGANKLTGNELSNNLVGGPSNDVLIGLDGADRLFGYGGDDVLAGGAGDDVLHGGDGRNILIGGMGADRLTTGIDEDLLIGTHYLNESNMPSLLALHAEWTSRDRSFEDRTANLLGTLAGGRNGADVLTSDTLKEDGAADTLTGGSGRDWYFRNISAVDTALRDLTVDDDVDSLFAEIGSW